MQLLSEILFGTGGVNVIEAFFWIPLAAGAALGGLKYLEGKKQADAQRKTNAEITRYSPWTGMQAQAVRDPSLLGDVMTGSAMGAAANGMFPSEAPAAPTGGSPLDGGTLTPGMDALKGAGATPQFSFESPDQGGISSWLKMAKKQGQPSLYSNQ